MSILITIIGFGVMILLHELGHFLAAKRFGVTVHEFSIGMGPKIFSVKKNETTYSLRLFPIGGYVKLEGETKADDETDKASFINLHPLKRIIVLFAGAFMNLLLGILIFTVINANMGVSPSVIHSIPAEFKNESPFNPGDEIIRLNNTRTHTYDDVSLFLSRNTDKNITVTFLRNGEKEIIKDMPLFKTDYGYKLGVTFSSKDASFFESIRYAMYDTVYITKAVVFALSDLITGRVGLNALSGPVEIISVVGEVTETKNEYTLFTVLMLFAMITVNLGIFNLLPFPALDGGSIIFALYELLTKRKVKEEIVGYVTAAGFVLLMLLAVFVTAGDIRDLLNNLRG